MLKVIIVDDEKSGREILASILHDYFPRRAQVIALCKNVSEGLDAIAIHQPDIIFLDIEMQGESGFDLVEMAPDLSASVVFVTAYNHHAIHAFKVNALDYLLKPVQIADLSHTIDRVEKIALAGQIASQQQLLQKLTFLSTNSFGKVGLPSLQGLIFIDIQDIIRCEASDNYTLIITSTQQHVISRTLKDVEQSLSQYNFLRIHKSHLVNLAKVVKYFKHDGGTLVMQDNAEVPVGRQAKDELERRLVIL